MHIYVSKWWNPSRWVLGITLSLFFMLTEHIIWASLVAQMVTNPPAMQGTWVQSLSCEDPLEEGMATQSSILAWRIPYGQRSLAGYSPWGHKESDMTERLSAHMLSHIRRNRKMAILGLEELILLTWPYYQMQSIDLTQPLSKYS